MTFETQHFYNILSELYNEFDAHCVLWGLSFSPRCVGRYQELLFYKFEGVDVMLEKVLVWWGEVVECVVRVQSQSIHLLDPNFTSLP